MTAPTRLGLLVALATLAADQASKLGLLFGLDLPLRAPVDVLPFLTLTSVWNRGISYGLLQQSSDGGRLALVAVSVAATVLIGLWLRRATGRLLPLSLGLIAGGAVGNTVDRIAYGAVFDFVHLHAGPYSWYVFNVADVAIVAGVAGLVIDALRPQGRSNAVPAQKLPD